MTSRNPDRIMPLLDVLGEAWLRSPDLRLGQLLAALAGEGDPFYLEDDVLLERLKTWQRNGSVMRATSATITNGRGESLELPLSISARIVDGYLVHPERPVFLPSVVPGVGAVEQQNGDTQKPDKDAESFV